ncbi:hypothetical protein C8R46DRAFT_1283814 [Mycena filopes]|nr:hypothetical protein C8R46DRAFT_1283814 [Mycena filopes]
MIPAGTLPVLDFVDFKLPHTSSELVYGESRLWFSQDEPTTDPALLTDRSIPPAAVVELLTNKCGQAWLDGAKSITDPRYGNDGTDRFPVPSTSFLGPQCSYRLKADPLLPLTPPHTANAAPPLTRSPSPPTPTAARARASHP